MTSGERSAIIDESTERQKTIEMEASTGEPL
jgi:hypothetical protein